MSSRSCRCRGCVGQYGDSYPGSRIWRSFEAGITLPLTTDSGTEVPEATPKQVKFSLWERLSGWRGSQVSFLVGYLAGLPSGRRAGHVPTGHSNSRASRGSGTPEWNANPVYPEKPLDASPPALHCPIQLHAAHSTETSRLPAEHISIAARCSIHTEAYQSIGAE